MKAGRLPDSFLPIQSGVGNIANAVLGALGNNPDIPAFSMYSEVLQDSVIELIEHGRIKNASATSLTVTPAKIQEIYANPKFFRERLVLRPQEISNSPEVARRIGIISINTAIEVDLSGNVNSSHIMGKNLMNGIGGSGDFTRAAYTSIYTCPSVAKGGMISAIVPNVSHCDHNEHSVNIIVTEYGVADLRCKTPYERAEIIIEKCAHPSYRDLLRKFLKDDPMGHTPQTLAAHTHSTKRSFPKATCTRQTSNRRTLPEHKKTRQRARFFCVRIAARFWGILKVDGGAVYFRVLL